MNGRIAVSLWEGGWDLDHPASSHSGRCKEGGRLVWNGVCMSQFIWLGAQECMPHLEPRVHFVWQSDMARERMPQGLSVTSSDALSCMCRTVQSSRWMLRGRVPR